jgi:hypothetical protein
MNSLKDVHTKLAGVDTELEKLAREEDAAGRIMARGFAAEINKLAGESPMSLMGKTPSGTPRPNKTPEQIQSQIAGQKTQMPQPSYAKELGSQTKAVSNNLGQSLAPAARSAGTFVGDLKAGWSGK